MEHIHISRLHSVLVFLPCASTRTANEQPKKQICFSSLQCSTVRVLFFDFFSLLLCILLFFLSPNSNSVRWGWGRGAHMCTLAHNLCVVLLSEKMKNYNVLRRENNNWIILFFQCARCWCRSSSSSLPHRKYIDRQAQAHQWVVRKMLQPEEEEEEKIKIKNKNGK